MDFLDPKKQRRHTIMLFAGYFLIGAIVIVATTVLLYEAYGFGLGKNGTVIQKGLIYLSSQPSPAHITVNGRLSGSTTNTALILQEGIYNVQLSRSGYRTWSRSIEVNGGTIESYTYPLLIPTKLVTSKVKTYSTAPALATQSLNRRWLLINPPGSISTFDLIDLSNTAQPVTTVINLPSDILTKATSSESWQVVAWANDNQHVLLSHIYDSTSEYILFDIANPSQSINLSQTLSGLTFSVISLDNERYDQYYLFNEDNHELDTVSLSAPTSPTQVLSNVITYDTYGTNTVLYATTTGAASGKVNIDELVGNQNYHIKTFDAGTSYLLNEAGYSGSLYVTAGAVSENKVYIFKDPIGQIQANPKQLPVPVQVLFVANPNYVSFSNNTQFIVAEGGQQFGVYDLEKARGYKFNSQYPLDSPQPHATWMDGNRLTYVSGGKLVIFEYDNNYSQIMMPASSSYLPFFDPSYVYTYTLTPSTSGLDLTRTSFYIPADQP